VGVIGIGGLGHRALRFLSKWGCEVTAFTSSPSKYEAAKQLGALSSQRPRPRITKMDSPVSAKTTELNNLS